MKQKEEKGITDKMISMPEVNPQAAGIDVGSRSHYVCVSQDNVKEFPSHTAGLHDIARHLLLYKVKTVAMESTGFYWQQLFILLQDYGFAVTLVNARHLKNVKGHKTDVVDSQWLQLMHSIGALPASFQPELFTKELRQYTRHRRSMIETSSRFISKMNKSLVLMNIQLKTVLSDLTGESGLKIIEAIVQGERNPVQLEKLVGKRVKATRIEIQNALTGDWRPEHLFELSENFEFYKFTWEKIAETDKCIECLLEEWQSINGDMAQKEEYAKKKHKPRQKNEPKFDVKSFAYQMTNGVDLSEIDGVGTNTILTLMSEVGFNLKESFKTGRHFASWLGFTPNHRITGGKKLSSKTEKVKGHLAYAIRQAANTAGNSKGRMGDFFRRLAFRKGRNVAIIATARKIAVIIYKMLETGQGYSYDYSKEEKKRIKQHQIKKILRNMGQFDIKPEELNIA